MCFMGRKRPWKMNSVLWRLYFPVPWAKYLTSSITWIIKCQRIFKIDFITAWFIRKPCFATRKMIGDEFIIFIRVVSMLITHINKCLQSSPQLNNSLRCIARKGLLHRKTYAGLLHAIRSITCTPGTSTMARKRPHRWLPHWVQMRFGATYH